MTQKQHGELDTRECPYCGKDIKVYRRHLPCEGVPNMEGDS